MWQRFRPIIARDIVKHSGKLIPVTFSGSVNQCCPGENRGPGDRACAIFGHTCQTMRHPYPHDRCYTHSMTYRLWSRQGLAAASSGRSDSCWQTMSSACGRQCIGSRCCPLVMGVRRCVLNPILVTGYAGIVELFILEPVAAAGGVAVHAVKLAGFGARAHQPGCVGVVLPKVPAVWIKVGVLQCCDTEVIEKTGHPAQSWR